MSLSNRSVSNSPTPSILLKARRFGIFSIFTVTAIIANPLLVKAQIAVDDSTATEVKGNAIAPVDRGTINGGNLYHSFDKFNVPNSGVIFNTGNSSVDGTKVNNIINRVTGDTPSSILGTIESRSAFPNANLYLLNPNGVVFGATARLDIGGSFNVTTGTSLGFDQNQKFSVDKNSLSFPTGDPKNIQFAIAQPAAIINQGNLTVDAGKNISLTAGTVISTGNLTATNGNVNLAAVSGNSQVELRSPDAVLGFEVNKDVIPSNWNGAIATLPKLAELLTGKASQANQVVVKPDGTISLVANPNTSGIAVRDGMNITSGKIDVSSSTGKGGNVGIFGNQVGLVNSLIDASGINGGGTVLIGGDFQGKGIAPNALQTYVDESSKIFTNGLLVGDGGRVIVWADRSTQFFGAIAAKGGEISGNGGFVEVSGKENLDYRGSTNALAPHGKIGTLLLDPTNITIIDTTGNSTLANASAFNNISPAEALLSNLTINSATANVLLQATNDITFNANINITAAGVGLTAQAGNSIISDGFGNGTITTNGGNVSLIANDPAFATGTGNITLGGNITTNGGNINLAINNAGRLLIESTAQLKSGSGNITLESKTTTGTNSGISINGNVIAATPSNGSILIDASSTSLDAVSFGANAQVISDAGSITINGISATANGIRSVDGVRIQSTTGAIALTGISNGGTGDGVVIQGGNTIVISNNGSNINIRGNAGNASNSGLNLTGTALTINSGTGNLTFTSDRSKFSTITGFGFGGAGALTLQPFSSTASLTIDSTNTGNLFLDSSFTNALAFSTNFTNLVIGNASSNNAISIINSLNINSNIAPIAILTARTLDVNGNDIITNGRNLTLTANQGITNLANITTAGGNVNISSATGNISATTSTNINTSNTDTSGGNISITANNGSLSLQNLDSSTTFPTDGSAAGNITLTVGGSNNISVANVIANRTAINNGNAGNLSFVMGTGNITLTGTNINLVANGGKGGSVTFPNPVILAGTPLINSFSVNTRGTTSSGNVIFENALTSPSPTGSRLSVLTSSGNITFNSTVGLSTAPLAQFLLDSDNTITLANTVFASSFTSNQGLTVINRNIVATGTFVPSVINLGNFTLNGDISLVGDEINLIGTGTSTALGNITLKPFTTGQAIAIGGTGDTGTGTLDLLATDISKFGAGGSLTIGHESGTGAISFAGATTFNRPTTVRSPVGAGNITINSNITATGSLTVQAGNAIAITNNAQITSSGGALSVILNSDRDADNSGRIALDSGTSINSNGGDVVLGGGLNPLTTPAVSASTTDSGVSINGNINASGGNVTVRGSNTLSSNGVKINGGGQVITNGTGNITIEGTGGSGSSNNQGIAIFGTGSLVQAVNGNIALTGTISGGTINNDGIRITDNAVVETTGTGNLNLTGTSNATGTNGTGILMAGAILGTAGTGNITLTGTSGTGTSSNAGISLGNTTSTTGQINTASGNISLTGTSRGTTNNNQGVLLGGNITVSASGSGNVSVTGTGANGVGNNNIGILLSFPSSAISVQNGNLNLNGTGQGTGTGNDGVFLSSGTVDALGTGNITLTGAAPTGSFGINLFNANIKPTNTSSGNLTLIANEMDARGTTNSIIGTGNLFIEPATATRNIIVGGTSNASDANLEINDTLLAGIQTGFTQVFIGRTDSSGLISLGSDLVFNNPVTLRSPLTTGAINTSGFNFRNITGNVTFLANQNITAGNIIASGNTTALTSTSGAINTSSGTIDTSADGNGGNISFSSATGSTVGSLNTASTVTGNAGAIAFTSGNITLAGSSINVSSNNGNAQNLTFGFPVTLSNSNLTINTGSLSGTNGAVTFSNVVNGSTAGVNNLTINSSSGSIAFNNSVGSSTIPLGAIFVNSTDTTRFNSTVNAASLNTNASGTIALNGNVTTTTSQIYNGAVNFTGALQLTSTNNDITFNSTVTGNQALTLNSGTGNITFAGAVGSNISPLGNLTANSTGITRFNSTVNAASLTTNTGGTTELNGNITTSGTQTFNDAVSLTNAVQLDTTNSAIAFGSTVNGTQNLTLNSGTANINFAGAVGNTFTLGNIISNTTGVTAFNSTVNAASLTTNAGGNTELNGNVTTTGSQTYNDQVILQNAVQLSTNSPIAFNNLVNGARNLTVSTGTANITFAGAVGNLQPLLALTTTSTGTITFTNAVIANSITSNSGTTVINGNLTANGVNGNGISLRNFTINGDISLIGDELNLLGTGSGTGNLSIVPFTSGQAIAIGGAGETNNTTFDFTATDIAALAGGTLSSLTIGDPLSTSAITLTGNVNFAQRTIIQSPVGTGSINSSGFNLTNTGGSLTLLSNQNITTRNITAAGNAIALTSTNGAINTSLGDIDAGGGNITVVGRNNITTSGVSSRALNGGTISLTSQTGTINTSAGDIITSTTNSRGTGGNITLTANGNVTTKGVFATGDNGKIAIASTTGGIDTTTGASSLESIGSNNSITLTAQQNIVTRDIFASGNQTSLSITSSGGLINTSLGTLDTSSTATNGRGGSITLSSTGTTIGNLNTSSSSGNAGAIAFSNGNITITGSDINTSSVSGTAASLNFAFPVILNTPTLTINTASTSGTSGNVTFTGNLNGTTANANNLVINAEGGALNFNGGIGNNIPLGNITLTTSGTTTFNFVNASNLKTINGGTVLLLGNVTSNGSQEYNGAVFFSPNITLNSSSGNGNIIFNGAIANNVSGTSSNLTFNAGTGNIQINKGAGSSGDRFGNITVTNAGNFSTGAGQSILADSFTQLAGTGTTSFGGNPDNFSGSLIVTTNNFSVDEGATLQAGNISITALGNATSSNGFSGGNASTLQVTGAGNITINADSNSDGIGRFLSRGVITDGGLGRDINIRAANLDIRQNVIAAQIFLTPSTSAPTIAIGSAGTGTFRLEDTTIGLLKATSLISIAANNGNVNIGSTQAFNTGASLEIGTTASPANIITSTTGSTLTVDQNLSATGTAIALGDTTVGGNLAVTGDTITLGNTTVGNGSTGNLTIRIKKEVSQTGTVAVGGQTNFIIDTNPLTNLLLADFANNFGSAISLSFVNLTTTSFNNLEFRTVNNGAQFNVAPQQINNLKLILDNGTIALPSIPLTGSLTLSAQDVSINGNITATSASLTSLNGGNVTISSNLTTTGGDLAIANSGTFRLNPNANLDLKGNLLLSGAGTTAIGGNITRSSDINFVQPVSLIGNSNIISTGNITFDNSVNGAFSAGSTGNFSNITSNGNITFNGTVDGKFALNLDANGNFAIFNAAIGGTTPLDSLAIASNTTLTSRSTFATTAITFNPIQISTTGNISLGAISNPGTNVTLRSSAGSISTGNITTTGQTGGQIFIDASQSINAGILNSSGSTRAGDVTLDPVGDVVVRAIDASSSTQGGNVTLVSTGGNLRITDTLLSSTTSSCVGASICTSGGTGGNISLQTGGLNPFLVDDATLNGSKGVLTTGATTVNLGTSIPVILSSSFIQGGIRVTPGGIITPTPTPTSTDSKQPFVTPDTPENVSATIPSGNKKSLGNGDILKKEAGRYLEQGNLAKAFDLLERSYGSELEVFVGYPLNLSSTTIDESQDVLAKVAQQTGDVAALIYPVLLDNRIEIMVVPPKEKGKPFRQFSVVPSQEVVESILTDYRNNIRDVGSNDYLEQSQKLYDWIMRPIDSQLKAMKINTLVFVMDAGLRVVPPAAMHDGKQFVVERYGIASVASMRVTRIEERDRKSTRVLAMGLTDSVSGFSALPSVDVEIKTIASNVLEGTAFLNKDFTVSNLQAQRQLGKYTILHLGTHGKFVSDNSGESFIQFWDSRLSLSQIPKLRFDKPAIDMLTLSACQTAVGNNLGISGLAVESGAKSVLASLWEVSDAGTAPLMISFYKAFPDAINKAQAMQKAQVSLLSGKVNIQNGQITGILGLPNVQLPSGIGDIDLSHPFYWSSFILVGNWL